MTSRRSRRWCFTINNPETDGPLTDDPHSWEATRYLIWQLEAGESGTSHYQGFVVFDNAYNLSRVRRTCPRAHWEITRGTLDDNIKYCSKAEGRIDGPWERGNRPHPGKRNDLHECTAMIDSGKSMRKVALAYPAVYVKYHIGLKSYRLETCQARHAEPNIIILWGPTKCGKSKTVHSVFPKAYRKPKGIWWDGYHTQDTVVFDDFYGWIAYDEILRILDWYPLLVQFKGGYVNLLANTFVFTSNRDPMDWYRGGHNGQPERERSALWRRFQEFGVVMEWRDGDYQLDTRFSNMEL